MKRLLVLLLALFDFAIFSSNLETIRAEDLTTTEEITTLTGVTTTASPTLDWVDYQLERAKTLVMSVLVAVGGSSAVGGVVTLFLKKRKKQIDDGLAAAKKAYDDAKDLTVKTVNTTAAKIDTMAENAVKFQEAVTTKLDTTVAKTEETLTKATTMMEQAKEREERMAALLEEEIKDIEAKGL